MDRSDSWDSSKAFSKPTAIRPTIRSVGREWYMRLVGLIIWSERLSGVIRETPVKVRWSRKSSPDNFQRILMVIHLSAHAPHTLVKRDVLTAFWKHAGLERPPRRRWASVPGACGLSRHFGLRVLSGVKSSDSGVDCGIPTTLQDNCLLQIMGVIWSSR